MISPTAATIIVVCFLLVFGVGLPVLNVKIPKFVSYRWCVIVVVLALLIGAVIDFEVLSDESRQIVLISGMVIGGAYVLLRTIEKVLANGWLHGASIEAKKGDISVKLTSTSQEDDQHVKK